MVFTKLVCVQPTFSNTHVRAKRTKKWHNILAIIRVRNEEL
jgi:hypothetical protein